MNKFPKIIHTIVFGLFVNGVLHLVYIFLFEHTKLISSNIVPYIVATDSILEMAVYTGVFFMLMILIVSIFVLKIKQETMGAVIFSVLVLGSLGTISSSYAGIRGMNMSLDNSKGKDYLLMVLDKKKIGVGRGTSYHVYTNDWNNKKPREEFRISNDFFHKININERLILNEKAGFFNYKWIASLEKSNHN